MPPLTGLGGFWWGDATKMPRLTALGLEFRVYAASDRLKAELRTKAALRTEKIAGRDDEELPMEDFGGIVLHSTKLAAMRVLPHER